MGVLPAFSTLRAQNVAYGVLVGLAVLVSYWAMIALYAWSEVGWVRRLNSLLIVTGGFGSIVGILKAAEYEAGAWVVTTIYLTVAGFMIGINIIRLILSPSHPVLSVARTMVEEAIRLRVAVVIIIFYLVNLATLPLVLGSTTV